MPPSDPITLTNSNNLVTEGFPFFSLPFEWGKCKDRETGVWIDLYALDLLFSKGMKGRREMIEENEKARLSCHVAPVSCAITAFSKPLGGDGGS